MGQLDPPGLIERSDGFNRGYWVNSECGALHVGTRETAIENLLRRIHEQADGGSRFLLCRVSLMLDAALINDGYRDEDDKIAHGTSLEERSRFASVNAQVRRDQSSGLLRCTRKRACSEESRVNQHPSYAAGKNRSWPRLI